MSNNNDKVETAGGCYCRVLTRDGWTPISAIEVGNEVIGSNGKLTPVVEVQVGDQQECIELTFNDSSHIYVDNLTELNLIDPEDEEGRVKRLAVDLLGEIRGDQREKYQFPNLVPYADDHESDLPIPPSIFMQLLMKEGPEESADIQKVFTHYGMKKFNEGMRFIPTAYVYRNHETRSEIFDAVTSHLTKDEFDNPIGLMMPSRTMALSFVELARFLGYICTSEPIEDTTGDLEYSNASTNLTPRIINFFNRKKLTSIGTMPGVTPVSLLLGDDSEGFLTDAHILIKPYTV